MQAIDLRPAQILRDGNALCHVLRHEYLLHFNDSIFNILASEILSLSRLVSAMFVILFRVTRLPHARRAISDLQMCDGG